MLEIVALIFGTRHLAKVARERGYSGWFGAVFPVLWIGFELVSIVIGMLMGAEDLGILCVGYIGALIGAGIAFAVVYSLPNKELDFDDDLYPSPARSTEDVKDNVWSG